MICVITVDPLYCCTLQQHLCQHPEDGSFTETCGNKLIVKYIIHIIVHFLVLVEFGDGNVKRCGVNQL